MKVRLYLRVIILVALATTAVWAGDGIPKAAWRRPLGLPLEKPGVTRIAGNIDDGFWQGAPVGGFGAGTFSRSYRGDFVRWHIKAGVNKYQSIPLNQFSVYEKAEGSPRSLPSPLVVFAVGRGAGLHRKRCNYRTV